jgi:hypothetical protein
MSPATEIGGNSPLTAERVIEKGREWLIELLGPSFPGPVHLAGGAYKTLIHGRPPRDIDLWAPTTCDQARIIGALLARGARLRGDNPPYQRVFERRSLVVEVAYSTSATSLEARLAGLGHGSGQRPNPPVPPSRRGKGGTPTEKQVRLPPSVSAWGLGGVVRWPGL